MPLMCFWCVRVKVLVAVFAFGAAHALAIVAEEAALAFQLCTEGNIEVAVYAFGLEAFMCYVVHVALQTQKQGAKPSELLQRAYALPP